MISKRLKESYIFLVGIIIGAIVAFLYDLMKAVAKVLNLFPPSDFQEAFSTIFAGGITVLVLAIPLYLMQKKMRTTPEFLPEIILDKESYSSKDKILIQIISLDSNEDSERQEAVKATVSSSKQRLIVELLETESDSGIFETELQITPETEPIAGHLVVGFQDFVNVKFVTAYTVASKTVPVKNT